MNEKRKLELMALEGNVKPYLEIEYCPNGDIYVNMFGQDERGTPYRVSAQVPSPIRGGGGNINTYKVLMKIYEILESDRNAIYFDDLETRKLLDKMAKSLDKGRRDLLNDRARTGVIIEKNRRERAMKFNPKLRQKHKIK